MRKGEGLVGFECRVLPDLFFFFFFALFSAGALALRFNFFFLFHSQIFLDTKWFILCWTCRVVLVFDYLFLF